MRPPLLRDHLMSKANTVHRPQGPACSGLSPMAPAPHSAPGISELPFGTSRLAAPGACNVLAHGCSLAISPRLVEAYLVDTIEVAPHPLYILYPLNPASFFTRCYTSHSSHTRMQIPWRGRVALFHSLQDPQCLEGPAHSKHSEH